ncbi:hypothetical protein [Ruminococcus sp.]|uniref:hypothetical protein n=1 Tax=Ruminococcus sp. TaxID=41978 RepID=UPI00402936F1
MRVKVKIKGHKKGSCLLLIERMIIYKKVDLSKINKNIRIKNPSIYVTALRLAREENSVNSYINILNILYSDICICKNKHKKDHLKRIFLDYINLNPFQGEIQFENYKKYILQSL